jgi:H+-transporting ATPase
VPGPWLIVSSIADLTLITVLASKGLLMTALPLPIIAGVFVAAVIFCVLLDGVKWLLFKHIQVG